MAERQRTSLLLIVIPLITGMVLLHHPSGSAILADAAAGGSNDVDRFVHWFAMLAQAALLLATVELTAKLHPARSLAIGGCLCYGIGTVFLIAAAVASGLVAPALAARVAAATAAVRDLPVELFRFTHDLNDGFATVGFCFASFGVGLWSIAMIRSGWPYVIGGFGVIVGTVGAAGEMFPSISDRIHGFSALLLAAQFVWFICVGVIMHQMSFLDAGRSRRGVASESPINDSSGPLRHTS